jgi:adenosylcobinamide hydrolase
MAGWRVRRVEQAHIIEHPRPHRMLSSAPVGGGWTRTRTVLIHYVSRDYDCTDPVADLRIVARDLGIEEPFVGFLTAVHPSRLFRATERQGSLAVSVWATVGLRNATAAGLSRPVCLPRTNTINLFIVVHRPLLPGAMVNAVITATEAKVAALARRGVRTPEGWIATGTSTDAVAIACPPGRRGIPYAGPVTPVGWLIARAVDRILEKAVLL